jgi:hypothetical protein
MTMQLAWFVSLLTCVTTALVGQAELLGEPWRHYVTVGAVIMTALSGFMLKNPPPPWDGINRRKDAPDA